MHTNRYKTARRIEQKSPVRVTINQMILAVSRTHQLRTDCRANGRECKTALASVAASNKVS